MIGFAYEKWLKKLILKLKFYHKKDVGKFLSERLALLVQLHPVLNRALEEGRLVVTFLPAHWYRHYFQKGYNQSQLLAKLLADQLACSCFALAKKTRATASQLSLKREKRLKNLAGVFESLEALKALPKGAVLVLVDDVTTTGASLNELATTLKNKRPDLQYWGLVIARHMGG